MGKSILRFNVSALFFTFFYFLSISLSEGQKIEEKLQRTYLEILKSLSEKADFRAADSLYQLLPNESNLVQNTYKNLINGQIESYKTNLPNSNFYYFEALKSAIPLKSKYLLSEIYQNLAINFRQQNQVDSAVIYYKKALGYIFKLQDQKTLSTTLINIGIAFSKLNKPDSAQYYYDFAFKLNGKNKIYKAIYWVNSADLLVQKGHSQKALELYQKAKIIIDDNNQNGLKSQFYIGYADILLRLHEPNLALNAIKQALISARKTENKNIFLNALQIKSKILENLGLVNEIVGTQKEIIALKDSINKEEFSIKLKTASYGLLYQIQSLKNKEQEKTLQNNRKSMYLMIIGILILVIAFSYIIYFYSKLKTKNVIINSLAEELQVSNINLETKVSQRTAELSTANAELIRKNFEITEALFKGQSIERKRVAAELHDNLGSTLSAVKWRLMALNSDGLSPKEKEIYESIKAMMGNAYEEVRHISHNLLPSEFEKYGLIRALENLVNDINESKKLVVKFVKSDTINNLNQKVSLEIYSLCLELLNNTMKHSNANISELKIVYKSNLISIKMADNGIGIAESILQNNGLNRLNERILSLKGYLKIKKNSIWSTIIEINFLYEKC